jgi:hypothetical protein
MTHDAPSEQTAQRLEDAPNSLPAPIPGAYVLIPSSVGSDDSIDLYQLLAHCWRRRWVFLSTLLLSSIPLLAWAVLGVPPVSGSLVLAPATTGLGEAGAEPIVSPEAFSSLANEVVIERLKATPANSSGPFPFADLKVAAVVPKGADFLRLEGTAPADAASRLEEFLALVVAELSEEQKAVSERLRQELEGRIKGTEAIVEALRLTAQMATPGSFELSQIGLEIAEQEALLASLRLQQTLMLPTRELRAFATDANDASAWRIRRIGLAASAAVAAAIAALSFALLVEGVRRHVTRP